MIYVIGTIMWVINFLPTIWQFIIQTFFQGFLLKLGKPWVQPVRGARIMAATNMQYVSTI
jgi:hypothetical protein